jgi:hypothetical protein
MDVHWFAWLCFSLAMLCVVVGLLSEDGEDRRALTVVAIMFTGIGFASSGYAAKQNQGLASRNTRYFRAQGYRVISAYGHKVCVAAGPYKLCLQERKDATGKKQLVMKLADGKWILVHGPGSGFMDALSHAPPN